MLEDVVDVVMGIVFGLRYLLIPVGGVVLTAWIKGPISATLFVVLYFILHGCYVVGIDNWKAYQRSRL